MEKTQALKRGAAGVNQNLDLALASIKKSKDLRPYDAAMKVQRAEPILGSAMMANIRFDFDSYWVSVSVFATRFLVASRKFTAGWNKNPDRVDDLKKAEVLTAKELPGTLLEFIQYTPRGAFESAVKLETIGYRWYEMEIGAVSGHVFETLEKCQAAIAKRKQIKKFAKIEHFVQTVASDGSWFYTQDDGGDMVKVEPVGQIKVVRGGYRWYAEDGGVIGVVIHPTKAECAEAMATRQKDSETVGKCLVAEIKQKGMDLIAVEQECTYSVI